ncbi:MAG: hypothetical protein ABSG08_21150 [Terriglobales bacterium]
MSEPQQPKAYNWEPPAETIPPVDPKAPNPFDRRTDLSADARALLTAIEYNANRNASRIIIHLWLIFVLLPFLFYVVYELATH